MNFRRFLVGALLVAGPILTVYAVKQSSWGPILATPKTRQAGDPKAKVVIVEYSDFQCPSCATVDPALHKFLDVYKGKIRVIYKYYPLVKIHKNAMPAAHAAECAAGADKFWPYHDRLFQTQLSWAPLEDPTTAFMAIAVEVKLDPEKFRSCYTDPGPLAAIERDAQEAVARDVKATPTFLIGDERLVGQVFETDGARAIEKALRQ